MVIREATRGVARILATGLRSGKSSRTQILEPTIARTVRNRGSGLISKLHMNSIICTKLTRVCVCVDISRNLSRQGVGILEGTSDLLPQSTTHFHEIIGPVVSWTTFGNLCTFT